jgi:uncharacterized protein (TIGR02266 family)
MFRWTPSSSARHRPYRTSAAGSDWGSATARRGTDRIPFEGRIVVMSQGQRVRASAGNISPGGAFVQTEDPPAVGTEVTLLIQLDNQLSLHISGVIRWHELDTWLNPIGCGLQFTNVSETMRDSINRMVSATRDVADDEAAEEFFVETPMAATGTNG